MRIAADLCIYTNHTIKIEILEATAKSDAALKLDSTVKSEAKWLIKSRVDGYV